MTMSHQVAEPRHSPGTIHNVSTSALSTHIILGAVFLFFSGLDRTVFNVIIPLLTRIDWIEQVYRVLSMIAFASIGFRLAYIPAFLAAINIILLPFNTSAAFINRTNLGLCFGYCGKPLDISLILPVTIVGSVIGAASVVLDYLYVATYLDRLIPAGLFENTSFVMPLVFAMIIVNWDVRRTALTGFILAACVMTGSRAVWGLAVIVVACMYGRHLAKPALVAAAIVVVLVQHPNFGKLAILSKAANAYHETTAAALTLGGQTGTTDKPARPTSASERAVGLTTLYHLGWRGVLPLAGINPNDVGHMGFVLYISVYGYALGLLCGFLAYLQTTWRSFLLFCVLSIFYTDPILSFGVGFLLLRSIETVRGEEART